MRTVTGCLAALLWAGAAFAVVGGGDVTLKNKGGDVVFSHDSHVGAAGIDCRECHDRLYLSSSQHKAVTMKQMEKGASCGACHNGKKAFSVAANCATCHRK
jgi:c(7)-type cytochrome triheme protein